MVAMYARIVIGWDGSDQARDALALAAALRAPGGTGTAVCVVPATGPGRGAELEELMRAQAQFDAEHALAGLNLDGLEVTAVAGASAAQGLDAYAESTDAELIVVGSSHHGTLGQVLVGSVGQRLLHGAPCAVAVAPKGFREPPGGPRVVGAAYDGSIESAHALVEARRYADSRGASLQIVTAVPPLDVWAADSLYRPNHTPEQIVEYRRAEFARILDDAAAPLTDELQAEAVLVEGRAADAIVQEARKGLDLLFLGSRGYGALHRAIAGSTATEVMRRAPCPVVVVPRGSPARGRAVASATVAR
jgi:nucleotide-binding universal stress UspA family protein